MGKSRRRDFLKRNSKKKRNTHTRTHIYKPGGGKGRSYFEVTMEVPGMQVSGKVDAMVVLEVCSVLLVLGFT